MPTDVPSCPKSSLAFAADKAKLYNKCTLADRSVYFDVSCKPICKVVEDDMEEISAVVSDEMFLDHWEIGTYHCARCSRLLYRSRDKWNGPCAWPSWRQPASEDALSLHDVHHEEWVGGYNGYQCPVFEVYCKGCDLFLGHQFADAKEKGDRHPQAQWRH